MKQKTILVLSGGGFKGAFQLGALRYLRDHWHLIAPDGRPMHFDIIAGISVGALNGVMMAMNKLDKLEELWQQVAENGVEEIYTSDFIDTEAQGDEVKLQIDARSLVNRMMDGAEFSTNIWQGISSIFSKKARTRLLEKFKEEAIQALKKNTQNFKGLADNSPLENKLKAHVDRRLIKDCEFFSGLVDLDHGLYHCLSHRDYATNDDFIKGIVASTAIPVVWEPIEELKLQDGARIFNSVDGGIRNSSPIGDVLKAIERDPEKDASEYTLVIINCNNGLIKQEAFKEKNILNIAARGLTEITLSEIFNNDLDLFFRINELAQQADDNGQQLFKTSTENGTEAQKPLRYYRSLLIQPEGHVLGNMLLANDQLVNRRIEHGIEQAKAALKNFSIDAERVPA